MTKMCQYQAWFLLIIVLNTIHANLDVDENLVLKICNMKFCDTTKTNVSSNETLWKCSFCIQSITLHFIRFQLYLV